MINKKLFVILGLFLLISGSSTAAYGAISIVHGDDVLALGNYIFQSGTSFMGTIQASLTGNAIWTMPDGTTDIVGIDTTQTLTNKDISSTTNTFPNWEQLGNVTGGCADGEFRKVISGVWDCTAGGGSGEINTASNVGTGVGVFDQKSGVDLEFNSLIAGAGIAVTDTTQDITLTWESTTSGFEIETTTCPYNQRVVSINNVTGAVTCEVIDVVDTTTCSGSDKVTAINNVTGVVTCSADVDTGEVNTASNIGTGFGWFKQKNGVDFEFDSIIGGSGISITDTTDDLTLSWDSTTSGFEIETTTCSGNDKVSAINNVTGAVTCSSDIDTGEVNTVSNIGAGSGIFKQKTGVNFEFDSFIGGIGITFSDTIDDWTIAIDSTVATLTGTQILTNKDISSTTNTYGSLEQLNNVTTTCPHNQVLVADANLNTWECQFAPNPLSNFVLNTGNYTIVENFTGAHGFTLVAGDATISVDTTEYAIWDRSLKVVMPATSANNQIENAGISPTIDITDKDVMILIKWTADNPADDVDNIFGFVWRMGQNFGNRYQMNLDTDINFLSEQDKWGWIEMPFSELTTGGGSGSPTEAAIDYVSWNVKNNGAGVITFWINAIAVVDRGIGGEGKIILRFDDSPATHFTEAMPYINKFGFKGNFNIIAGSLSGGLSLTPKQVLQIQDGGHLVATHAGGNLVTDFNNQTEIEDELKRAKNLMLEGGFKGSEFYTLPQGSWNGEVQNATNKYFKFTITGLLRDNIAQKVNWNQVNTMFQINNESQKRDILDVLDLSMTDKAVVVLMIHGIVDDGTETGVQINRTTFQGIIDHINTNYPKQVITYQQWIDFID